MDIKGEDGRKMSSIGCSSITANALSASEAFACLTPVVPGQGSMAKSLGVERKRYHAHFRSHSLASKYTDVTILRRNNVLF
jgi:hypothetical protein